MNGRDPVTDPTCGHCLTGHHQACYRGRLGCWCADRDHVEDVAWREKSRSYVYPEPDVYRPVKRRRVEVERPEVERPAVELYGGVYGGVEPIEPDWASPTCTPFTVAPPRPDAPSSLF